MSIFNLLTIFIIIISILLVAIILLQEPKERITLSGGGGGSLSMQRIGINQKADFLEKTTWLLVSLLLLFTLLSSVFLKNVKKTNLSPNLAKVQQEKPKPINTPLTTNSTEDKTLIEKND